MQDEEFTPELIAPCGINCALCGGYLALRYNVKSKGIRMPYCKGCRPRDKECSFLKKRCELLLDNKVRFCYECKDFPCGNLIKLDDNDKPKTGFRVSMIENLEFIKSNGITKFLNREQEKWKCPECGQVICCHNGVCFNCGLNKLKEKKNIYHWEEC